MRKILFLFLIAILSISCKSNEEKKKQVDGFDYSKFELKAGDILFQDSDCGPFCESIEKVTFGYKGSKFSHVGMVIPDKNGNHIVIEAISKGVVKTSLKDFFNRSFDENNNSKVVVGRIKKKHLNLVEKAIEFSQTKLGLAYDDVFDINNNKYYCSELIYDSFKHANNNEPIFELQKMTYKDPATNTTFPIWEDYFKKLGVAIPESKPGLNPGGMSKSDYIDIVHFYGIPEGYQQ